MATHATPSTRRGRLKTRLEQQDDYGLVLVLIIATIITIAGTPSRGGQFAGVCLSGFTLLLVLHTSGVRRRTFRIAAVIVIVAVAGATASLVAGFEKSAEAAGLVGLLLAFVAPLVILRRILSSPTITVRLVLGALAIYLLLGLTYAYLYPLIGLLMGVPFFVQTSTPQSIDFIYFSYVTLTTVGYGDFTAATATGRMIAVSEALIGQLYLVSAVALLVGNIGRTIVRGPREAGVGAAPPADDETGPTVSKGPDPP